MVHPPRHERRPDGGRARDRGQCARGRRHRRIEPDPLEPEPAGDHARRAARRQDLRLEGQDDRREPLGRQAGLRRRHARQPGRQGADHLDARRGCRRRRLQARARQEDPGHRLRLDLQRHVVGLRRARLRLHGRHEGGRVHLQARAQGQGAGDRRASGAVHHELHQLLREGRQEGRPAGRRQAEQRQGHRSDGAADRAGPHDQASRRQRHLVLQRPELPRRRRGRALVGQEGLGRGQEQGHRDHGRQRLERCCAGRQERPDHRHVGSAAGRHGHARRGAARDAPQGRKPLTALPKIVIVPITIWDAKNVAKYVDPLKRKIKVGACRPPGSPRSRSRGPPGARRAAPHVPSEEALGASDRPRLPRAHALARPRLRSRGDAPCRVRRARPALGVARARAPHPQPRRGQRARRAARSSPRPRMAERDELLRFHTPAYLERVAELSEAGHGDAGFFSPVGACSYEIAALAAGACLTAVDRCSRGARQRLRARAASGPSRAGRPRDGRMHLRQHGARGDARAGRAWRRARGDRRLGRPSRQRHAGGLLGHPSVCTISLHQAGCFPPDSGAVGELGGDGARGRT